MEPEKLAAVADYHRRLEWQLLEQCSTKFRTRSRFANDEGARGTYVDDIIGAQFFR
jgi:hypothetical protein